MSRFAADRWAMNAMFVVMAFCFAGLIYAILFPPVVPAAIHRPAGLLLLCKPYFTGKQAQAKHPAYFCTEWN